MSEPLRQADETDETTILHIHEFVSDHDGSDSERPGPADGPTLFFVKAAAETCEQSPRPVVNPKEAAALPPQAMLGIVSYCYAKGVFNSEDIERKMMGDEGLRSACRGDVPTNYAIRRFRRLNREAIQATLEKFFRRMRKSKILTEVMPGATAPVPAPTPGNADSENTQMFVRREASDRLDQATFVDGMSRTD